MAKNWFDYTKFGVWILAAGILSAIAAWILIAILGVFGLGLTSIIGGNMTAIIITIAVILTILTVYGFVFFKILKGKVK